jgi:adenylate cyclase
MAASRVERRLAAILMADVVGYSLLIGRDEAGTLAALKHIRQQVLDPLLSGHRGRTVKLLGDGLLAEFGSVVDAVNCAVSIQNEAAARQVHVPPESRIVFRIGVNLAARLEQLCEAGGVLISGTAYDHLEGKLDLPLDYTGEQQVKNIARPVRTYRVNLDGSGQPWRLRLRPYSRRLRWAGALIGIALAAGVTWSAFMQPGASPGADSILPSIAVLPFDDMSGQSAFGYFGDGVAEDIISMLSRVPELRVVARNSSFTYKGQPVDVRQVGKDLGVTHVLEGSVRKDTDRVRIVAQLVDARTGEHVWAERFDRSGVDPWALQDDVTERIVTALAGDTGTLKKTQYSDAWGKDSASLGEYDYYLRAHDLLRQLESETNDQALQIAAEGLSKFPDSALLKLELAYAHFLRGWNAWSDKLTAEYDAAHELVTEAMAEPALSPLERRLGHYLSSFIAATERKFERALSEAETAIELSPYDVYMLAGLSQIPIMAGRPAEALEWIDRAALLDTNPQISQEVAFYRGWALAVEGKLDEALTALESDRRGNDVFTPLMQAIVLNRLGRSEDAAAKLKEALSVEPKFTQATWRELFFYSDPSIVEREVADLASLGLPES